MGEQPCGSKHSHRDPRSRRGQSKAASAAAGESQWERSSGVNRVSKMGDPSPSPFIVAIHDSGRRLRPNGRRLRSAGNSGP